jgi:hypothetical protein
VYAIKKSKGAVAVLDYENLEVMVAAQVDKPLDADGTCPFKKPYFACEPLNGKVSCLS